MGGNYFYFSDKNVQLHLHCLVVIVANSLDKAAVCNIYTDIEIAVNPKLNRIASAMTH